MVRKKSEAKKEKLLAVAGDLFMEKGFRDATVAEICSRADANISAVNYHFGSKEALYQEAWRHSFDRVAEDVPIGWRHQRNRFSRRAQRMPLNHTKSLRRALKPALLMK